MAELTDHGNGSSAPVGGAPSPVDPRAVRVRLATVSGGAEEPMMQVAPVPEPLRMTNPTIGRGPLGGAAIAPGVDEPGDVLTQRQVEVDGSPAEVSVRGLGSGRWIVDEPGSAFRVVLEEEAQGPNGTRVREVLVDGFRFMVETESERIAALRERASQGRAASAHSGPLQVKAIIPGKVVAISVKAGDTVMAGQHLLVVEAMKMQNELRAPRDGTIEHVGVAVGVNIEIGDLLVVIS